MRRHVVQSARCSVYFARADGGRTFRVSTKLIGIEMGRVRLSRASLTRLTPLPQQKIHFVLWYVLHFNLLPSRIERRNSFILRTKSRLFLC